MRGIKSIFGDSQDMIAKSNELLQPLLQATNDERAVFALETFLCCIQKERVQEILHGVFPGANIPGRAGQEVSAIIRQEKPPNWPNSRLRCGRERRDSSNSTSSNNKLAQGKGKDLYRKETRYQLG